MGPEINIDAILALEKQLEQGLGDVIQLKRARNSLLNISVRVPPEVLGQVFRWNVIPVGERDGLEKGSYNFLLVCHHWFEVASGTPELWTYWGNTLQQWWCRYQRSGTAPLDLVLDGINTAGQDGSLLFKEPLRGTLRAHVACDSIQSIYIGNLDGGLVESVVSSLTLDGEDIRDIGIESLTVTSCNFLNISPFLTRYRFPRLRVLSLCCRRISSWDQLKIQATSLTTLSLSGYGSPTWMTRRQFLSTFASFPNLEELSLCEAICADDVGYESTSRVPLPQLKNLCLEGLYCELRSVFDWLEDPDKMDTVHLELTQCEMEDLGFFGQYLRDRVRRDGRFQGGLGLRWSRGPDYISFAVGALGQLGARSTEPGHGYPFVSFQIETTGSIPEDELKELYTDLLAVTPQEHVVEFAWGFNSGSLREIDLPFAIPNVGKLCLLGSVISGPFLQPDQTPHTKLLPSLRHLYLHHPTLKIDDDWGPLTAYLAHQHQAAKPFPLNFARTVLLFLRRW